MVAETSPDAETDESITLVRGVRSGGREEEAVENGDETGGTTSRSGNDRAHISISANWTAKHRVTRGDGGAVATQHGISTSRRGQSRITKSVHTWAENGADSGTGGTIGGKAKAKDGGLARSKGEAKRAEVNRRLKRSRRRRRGRSSSGSKERGKLSSNLRGTKDMDVVTVGNDHTTRAQA